MSSSLRTPPPHRPSASMTVRAFAGLSLGTRATCCDRQSLASLDRWPVAPDELVTSWLASPRLSDLLMIRGGQSSSWNSARTVSTEAEMAPDRTSGPTYFESHQKPASVWRSTCSSVTELSDNVVALLDGQAQCGQILKITDWHHWGGEKVEGLSVRHESFSTAPTASPSTRVLGYAIRSGPRFPRT